VLRDRIAKSSTEIRSPKSEIRKKAEADDQSSGGAIKTHATVRFRNGFSDSKISLGLIWG